MRVLAAAVGVVLAACGPAEVELSVNIVVSPAWGSTIEAVDLMDIGGDSVGRTCAAVLAADVADCSIYGGYIPPSVPCALQTWTLSADPGTEGRVLHLTTGEHTIAVEGLDSSASVVAADCAIVTVVEGKTAEVSFQL